ncbi:membrane-associated tyrosine- and threonine-specific cdc2-inhibitory kinase [Nephila pilipes]|uniref:Membrane-associated tyrosine- and threonine-specific cdc2-inhibitory kinase n=1 Tax=Nephila pilipes TaxID=299642 RepID=A0A8X6UMI3_NEPPI|nr:membrane-associated tyrosine- and threonine-specific cdc2-inhibitory kinase [Nephila pilipes]
MKSPLPTPKFYAQKSFSSKKERRGLRSERPPPTPRVKLSNTSCSSVRGLHSLSSNNSDHAQSISFRDSKSSLSSKYDSSSDQSYFHQCFEIISKIGSGSFGDVFKVKCIEDGDFYAIKKAKQKYTGKADRERKLQEVQKHEQLPNHPNCVKFYKAWEEQQILYIQIELCKYSLSQYAEENHNITENTIWNFLIDLLLAVKHLHDHDLIHLDIKPDNIFISKSNICKLGDFGLVLDLSKPDTSDANEGDPRYLAPELMDGKFTKAADVFSLGITILELASDLDLPHGDETWHKLRNLEIPSMFIRGMSCQLLSVISRMMEPNYLKRACVHEILNIEFVDKYCRKRQRIIKSLETINSKMPNQPSGCKSVLPDLSSSISDDVFERSSNDSYHSLNNSSTDKRLSFEEMALNTFTYVFEKSSNDSYHSLNNSSTDKRLSIEEVALNTSLNLNNSLDNSIDSSRYHFGMSTPCSLRYRNSKFDTSGSPCLSGGKKKDLLPDDGSPLFKRSPRLQLFNDSSSDGEESTNPPPKKLLNVFDALSPTQ